MVDDRAKELTFFPFKKIRGRIHDMGELLTKIGATWKAHTALAFHDQRLGDIPWPAQYPNMEGPFVNIAGALSDLNSGGRVKGKRFMRAGPGGSGRVLHETGQLKSSIDFSTNEASKSVSIFATGRPATYAGYHQWGSPPESVMPVSEGARKRLAEQLRTTKKDSLEHQGLRRLGFLFSVDELKTDVVQRPFIGFTDDFVSEVHKLVQRYTDPEYWRAFN